MLENVNETAKNPAA